MKLRLLRHRSASGLALLAGCILCPALARGAEASSPQQTWEQMLRLLPKSEPWEQWFQSVGKAPPNFDTMASVPWLPDPLRSLNGKPVRDQDEWPERRQELLKLLQRYVTGNAPPPPDNLRVSEMSTRREAEVTVQNFVLEFGPQHLARLHVELLIPAGKGPFPVFLTQDNHRRWALIAASRGYLACVYAGADSRDDTPTFLPHWPGYDWTKLTRRAWAASRCIDHLLTLKNVDRKRIAITGHSRNGKLALIAAALDERITAVISSSSGAGGACSYRLFSETEFGEGIELITRSFPDWLHPRLRFFAGRENRLPIDQHELIACIAPRPCLISSALNDDVESIWAIEQTWREAGKVYELLGVADALQLRYRPFAHETRAEDIEAYLDWLDLKFGRGQGFRASEPIFPTYAEWLKVSREKINPEKFTPRTVKDLLEGPESKRIAGTEEWARKKKSIREQIDWVLGDAPPAAVSAPGDYGSERPHLASMLGRSAAPAGIEKRSVNFGNYLAGDLYLPANAAKGGRLPVVVWLHPISVSNGYVPGYRRGEAPHLAMARAGFAVFAFDQIGNGSRIEEVRHFYERYPHWSLLGKTVQDTRAAVDALLTYDFVDPKRIFLLGYATGGMAALHAAALDERVAGVVSVAGFTPMRLDVDSKGTGGVARWSHWLPLLPRLGPFVGGNEDRIPYDYHELLAMIAPRPVTVVRPAIDYRSTAADVKDCVTQAAKVFELYQRKDNLQFVEVEDYNRFSPELQQKVYALLRTLSGP